MSGKKSKGVTRLICAVLLLAALCPAKETFAASYSRMNENEKAVYLTFDDGPDTVNTVAVMDILMKYGVKGTFFFTGANMNKYPEVTRLVYENGFGIGLHGYAHSSLAGMSAEGVRKDINAANNALEWITGERSLNMRPPYGAVSATSKSTLDAMGFSQYMWTIDPKDWSSAQTDAGAIKNIKDNLRPGAIILLHSARGQTRAARILPEVIEYILAEGYEIKELPDAGYKTVAAVKSEAGFFVNGEQTELCAYVIDGSSYVGARELARALSHTGAQFDVGWKPESKTIEIMKGAEYQGQETAALEAASGSPVRVRAKRFEAAVTVDGTPAKIAAYQINGASYYNLRELAAAVNAILEYDAAANTINLNAPVLEALPEIEPEIEPETEPETTEEEDKAVMLSVFPLKWSDISSWPIRLMESGVL